MVSPDAIVEEKEQNTSAPVDPVRYAVETPVEAAPEVATSAVVGEAVPEATPSAVIEEEEAQNGTVAKDWNGSGAVKAAPSEVGAGLADILPDGLVPLETADVAMKQPQVRDCRRSLGGVLEGLLRCLAGVKFCAIRIQTRIEVTGTECVDLKEAMVDVRTGVRPGRQ